jgi:hypothetical protein
VDHSLASPPEDIIRLNTVKVFPEDMQKAWLKADTQKLEFAFIDRFNQLLTLTLQHKYRQHNKRTLADGETLPKEISPKHKPLPLEFAKFLLRNLLQISPSSKETWDLLLLEGLPAPEAPLAQKWKTLKEEITPTF